MEFIDPRAQEYAERYTSDPDGVLDELAGFTLSTHPQSHMLSGKVQGRFLEMISCLMQPKKILEIGTFTGYSALCLAKGLHREGRLHTIEIRPGEAAVARGYFRLSVWQDQIILHEGNALNIIPELDEIWDLVFIDADKVHYIDYYRLVFPRLRKGGIILADNVLFHGEVLENEIRGKSARAIHAFNEFIRLDNQVEKVMLTVRDGLMLLRKK